MLLNGKTDEKKRDKVKVLLKHYAFSQMEKKCWS